MRHDATTEPLTWPETWGAVVVVVGGGPSGATAAAHLVGFARA